MLTMIGAVAAFERELMKERIAGGIESAKGKGTKFGRPNKVKSLTKEVAKLQAQGLNKSQIAQSLGISLSTVYRSTKR
ncbi:helix-turn-helix domain-containing protein [Ferrimonas sp. SCSIO 43195]|uniref:helix-turn-helix domain-containing protein n=1 Tax=Ferrimonas sp. SCSIO 43195 TaxID=2822844 RepID=UPI0020751B62|nr:helix-turn-helix domain-containing protein [Ferrimonas sp. SCSIO 43195]